MSSSITYDSFRKIKLIRYLVVWRVNGAFALLPENFSVELSHVLGGIIAGRLSSRDAARWRKALAPLDNCLEREKGAAPEVFPDVAWPIEAVIFVYPGKSTYGQGELIFWELKLFGDTADHGFFLETILPAMEEASFTSEVDLKRHNRIWGRFDIHAVFAARGPVWEPVVSDGRLDLRCQVNASQWAEGLTLGSDLQQRFSQLIWLTPFDLEGLSAATTTAGVDDREEPLECSIQPVMRGIFDGLASRLSAWARGKRKSALDPKDFFDEDGEFLFLKPFPKAMRTPLIVKDLEPAPPRCPGLWTGKYVFSPIPRGIIPCLELASIIHIGRYTHFGCGTFYLA